MAESPHSPAITAANLSVTRGTETALSHVNLHVPAGTTLAVIGPNGSGKSTLLGAVAGLLSPAAGSIEVPARRSRPGVALVPQATDVDPSLPLTVSDAVAIARYSHLGPWRPFARSDRVAVEGALDRMDATALAQRQLRELSGGQRQRVFVAQGLAQEADLLLLDEPVTGLDIPARTLIFDAVEAERAAGRTIVVSTHDLDDARLADLVLLLAGRQVAFGPPDDVLTPEPLRAAFGGRLVEIADGALLLDDPHHHGAH